MTNVKPLWYVLAWSFPVMTLIASVAWLILLVLASFLTWDLSNLADGFTWIAVRIILIFSGFLTLCYVTYGGKAGGKKEWHQVTADKWEAAE